MTKANGSQCSEIKKKSEIHDCLNVFEIIPLFRGSFQEQICQKTFLLSLQMNLHVLQIIFFVKSVFTNSFALFSMFLEHVHYTYAG